jgi:hypothetical protein
MAALFLGEDKLASHHTRNIAVLARCGGDEAIFGQGHFIEL